MSPVLGTDLSKQFYCQDNCCILEKEIEDIFDNTIINIYPQTTIDKTKLKNGQTDGILKFYNSDNSLKFWVLQECKRDIGFKSVKTPRAFLQILYYLSNFYYDVSLLDLNKFKGIFLDSARFFCYIPKQSLDTTMIEFEPLFNKYSRVNPSNAYLIPELSDWVIGIFNSVKKYLYLLDSNFRFDLFIQDLYENKI